MKKMSVLFLALCLVLTACGGEAPAAGEQTDVSTGSTVEETLPAETGTPEETPAAEPEEAPLSLWFSSGAGAWATEITIQPDGSFEGTFHDTDMGDFGEDYPDGTVYLCSFEGKFSEKRPLDEYSFAMELESLTSDYEEGKEWIEDGVRFVSSIPYGMEQGKEFILYLPETPVAGLDEMFLSWWPRRGEDLTTLELTGLWNTQTGHGFFG